MSTDQTLIDIRFIRSYPCTPWSKNSDSCPSAMNRREFLTASAAAALLPRFACNAVTASAPASLLKGKAEHVISIWLAHRLALREFGTRRRAALATVPLTLLMVAYTIISLSVIAEPMVKFDIPETVISD